jgi:hypothetical protein
MYRLIIPEAVGMFGDCELDLLFDSGVFDLRKLPLCKRFIGIAAEEIGKRETVMTSRQIERDIEARKCELLVLKLEDDSLWEFVGGYVRKSQQLKMFHELLQLRLYQSKMWQRFVDGMNKFMM